MKSDPIGTAVDFGDGVIKACLVYPDRLEPFWVDEGSESFANAVYKDPTTGEVITDGVRGLLPPCTRSISWRRDCRTRRHR